MRLTKAVEYGIRALLYLVQQPPDKACLISEISRAQGIPEKFLAKIMQSLAREGIVKSYRGVKGGFSLARAPEDVTLKDAVECLDGPLVLFECLSATNQCKRSRACNVRTVWMEAQEKLLETFEKATLKTLSEKRRIA